VAGLIGVVSNLFVGRIRSFVAGSLGASALVGLVESLSQWPRITTERRKIVKEVHSPRGASRLLLLGMSFISAGEERILAGKFVLETGVSPDWIPRN
jgi:hypothetical protein